jgi:type II secretory pathway component GspD/PulD (secretin)
MKSQSILSLALLSLILATPAFCGEAASHPDRFRPQFVDVPLEALAEAVGKATGKIFVIPPGIHTSITMKSDRSLSSDELYAEFQFALGRQGLRTFQRGDYIFIQRAEKKRLIRV